MARRLVRRTAPAVLLVAVGTLAFAAPVALLDLTGRTIDLAAPAERIVTFPVPSAAAIIALDGGIDRLAGIHPESKLAIEEGILGEFFPEARNIPSAILADGATRGTLPAEFDLAATATRFSRADGLQLIISGAGGAEELVVAVRSVEGCFEPFTERGPATASAVSIPAARFVLTPNGPATCNVDVTVRAVAHGTPDPAFGRGGLVTLSQVRTLALTFDR